MQRASSLKNTNLLNNDAFHKSIGKIMSQLDHDQLLDELKKKEALQ